jgi:hypothetical protein
MIFSFPLLSGLSFGCVQSFDGSGSPAGDPGGSEDGAVSNRPDSSLTQGAESGTDAASSASDGGASTQPDAGSPAAWDSSTPSNPPGNDAGQPEASSGGDDAAPIGHYACGYPCDPVSNTGCPSGQSCDLESNNSVESASCKDTSAITCGFFAYSDCVYSQGSVFYGAECVDHQLCYVVCTLGAYNPQCGAEPCLASSNNGCYGYCNITITGQ